jgi:molybdopterin molybdotransferase
MKFNRNVITVAEAQARIAKRIAALPAISVNLTEGFGLRLAEDISATHDVPHFARSGMDGFAVKSTDIQGASPLNPIVLEVNQTIPCGNVPKKSVENGQASRIMTGAPVPDGADTVVMFEMTEDREHDGDAFVAIKKEIEKGANISPIGDEMTQGDFLLEMGRRINPGEAALLATFGYSRVQVYRKPKVAILATGSELISIEAPMQAGKIRNSNSFMLAAQVKEAGGDVVIFDMVPDDRDKARSMIFAAMEEVDAVITTGGVSVGDYDIMADLFDELDDECVLFNKVAMRPGSPTTVGHINGKFLFGLSGNPGACFVGFELFVRPVLIGMQGKKDCFPPVFTAFLKGDYRKANAYERYIRGSYSIQEGKVYVQPEGKDKSSISLSIKDSNCLIIIPPGGKGALDGELVRAVKLSVTE